MEPRIQYAKTSDGVSIAYWTLGQGQPLLFMQQPLFSTIAGATLLPEIRAWCDRISATREVVILDHRGSGLSTRGITDFSIESMERDIDAVVHRLGADTVDLWGSFDSGPIAIAFAAHNPERVRRLVLWSAWARCGDLFDRASAETLERLIDTNWKLYCRVVIETSARVATLDIKRHVNIAAEGTEPQTYRTFLRQAWEYDVTDLLPLVGCPTLIANRRGNKVFPVELSSRLAAEIPNARLLLLERGSRMVWIGDSEAVASALDEFLGEADGSSGSVGHVFRTVLFTDIVAHTEMMSRLGDERGREVLREHERITREVLKAHGGTEVKTMGDGFMASFGSVTRAVECAVALQRAFDERNTSRPARPEVSKERADYGRLESVEPLRVRVGLNAGEPIEEDGDLFGATVILASRIAAKAEGGEILVADTVRGLCSGKGFLFADRGEFVAKGFEEPVRVYEVRWRE